MAEPEPYFFYDRDGDELAVRTVDYDGVPHAAAWGVLSLAEIPFRVLRAAALAVCPPDTHDVFEEET